MFNLSWSYIAKIGVMLSLALALMFFAPYFPVGDQKTIEGVGLGGLIAIGTYLWGLFTPSPKMVANGTHS